MTNAIETTDLTRRFRRLEAVHALTLRVPAGATFALIGPNGAGKTTTIKLLLNLLRPTRGRAALLGVRSTRLDARTLQRIGYVSENQRLPNHLTTTGLLEYCRPFYPTWDDGLACKLVNLLNVPPDGRLSTLSRGTRMKAAMLSALAYRPDLLVLDEPFGGLDPLVREELVNALLEIANEHPWSVFVSSHDVDEVERLADWVGFLQGGRLIFAEPVSSLLQRFRMIEVIGRERAPVPVSDAAWLPLGVAGRTLKFIDTDHVAADADARIRRTYGEAEIRISPLSLREIFIITARHTGGATTGDAAA